MRERPTRTCLSGKRDKSLETHKKKNPHVTSDFFPLQPELRNGCGQVSIVVVFGGMHHVEVFHLHHDEIRDSFFGLWGWLETSVGVRKTVKTQSFSRRIKIQESAHCHHCLTVEQQLHLM